MVTKKPPASSGPKDDDDVLTQLYRIAHDLGGPIRGMVGMAEILVADYGDKLDDQAKEYLGVIADCGLKARLMMDGLLQYMRVAKDATPYAPVDLNGVAHETKMLLDGRISDAGAVVEIGPLPTVQGSVTQLQLLLHHLIDNAVKFHGPGVTPKVVVAAEKNGDGWDVTVTDNGVGIAPDMRDRVFELYRRLHSDEEYPGVGAGLAIVKQIVTRHGGQIAIDGNAPQGSVFRVTLPSGT